MVDLKRMRDLIEQLPNVQFRVEKARAKSEKCTASLSGMPGGSRRGNQVEDGVAEIERHQADLDRITAELGEMRKELAPMIEEITDPDERTTLYLRYMMGFSPENVSDSMCWCERHTFRMLRRGEAHLQNVSRCQCMSVKNVL